ncbi:alpha/beta hydrolase [Actinomadura kijaniata]|uniref:alpha/beta hydrolase n=1 Tax=Actinomadura kijaniata TaxID=46161 RepID=UPI003F1D7D37
MRRLTLAVGSAAGALALTTTASPVLAAPSPQTPQARFAAQRIAWKPCIEDPGAPPVIQRLDCGTMTVPLDWNAPDGAAQLKIAVSRLRAGGGKARGAVFTNPGGPGGPGLTLPLALAGPDGNARLSQTMDIIGIDVRGTGQSTNVTCALTDPFEPLNVRDRGKRNTAKLLGQARTIAQACQKNSGTLGRHVTTWQTVRDLDLLRTLLGQKKIHWIGYSGGSWLGAHYATAFPKNTGRFVLDSNTEFTATWQKVFANQPMAFERRFRKDFTPWAAKYNSRYKLGRTGEQVRRTYEAMRAELVREPLPLLEGGTFYAGDLDNLIAGGLYAKANFPELARIMSVLRRYTGVKARSAADARDLSRSIRALRDRWTPLRPVGEGDAPDADIATFYGITCNDTPRTGTPADLARRTAAWGRKYPLVGYARIIDPCQYWKRPDVRLPVPTGRGVPPTLMVQSAHDPATSYEGAVAAHRKFAGSRLLSVTDEGDHSIYAGGNACVDKIVDAFVIDGVLPKKDLSCKGVPLPVPPKDVRSQSAATAPQHPLLRADELADRYRLKV